MGKNGVLLEISLNCKMLRCSFLTRFKSLPVTFYFGESSTPAGRSKMAIISPSKGWVVLGYLEVGETAKMGEYVNREV